LLLEDDPRFVVLGGEGWWDDWLFRKGMFGMPKSNRMPPSFRLSSMAAEGSAGDVTRSSGDIRGVSFSELSAAFEAIQAAAIRVWADRCELSQDEANERLERMMTMPSVDASGTGTGTGTGADAGSKADSDADSVSSSRTTQARRARAVTLDVVRQLQVDRKTLEEQLISLPDDGPGSGNTSGEPASVP